MPSCEFVDVRIVVDDQPLPEYQDPEATEDAGRHRRRFVEVKVGQRFEVQVSLQPGLTLQWAKHVGWECEIDHDPSYFFSSFSAESLKDCRGVLSQASSHECCINERRNEATGVWESCPLMFGALGICESCRCLTHTPCNIDLITSRA